MSRITIAQLETAETSIQELTVAELNATKGGFGFGLDDVVTTAAGLVGVTANDTSITGIGGTVDESLNKNNVLNGNLSGNHLYF